MNKSHFFDDYYDNAQMNSILIMNCDGSIIEVNKAFTNNFGYETKDLEGQNVNTAFLELFELTDAPPAGSSLYNLKHPFWNNDEIRKEISKIIVTNQPVKRKEFILKTKAGENKIIRMDSNIIHNQPSTGRRIFIIL